MSKRTFYIFIHSLLSFTKRVRLKIFYLCVFKYFENILHFSFLLFATLRCGRTPDIFNAATSYYMIYYYCHCLPRRIYFHGIYCCN